jgi:hypothetical protein
MAFASLRMEPVFMILSQSAGVAAVQAMRSQSTVQSIDIPKLQRTLNQQGQILKLPQLPVTAPRKMR